MGRLKCLDLYFDNNRTVFAPGQKVSGKCVVKVKDGSGPLKIRTIRIVVKGVARVHWTECRSMSNSFGPHTKHYSSEIEYICRKFTLFGSDSNQKAYEEISEGKHEYPFSFHLASSGLPTSFEGTYGSIRYWIKAEINKPWSINDSIKKSFIILAPIDIKKQEQQKPVEKSVEKTLCCWFCKNGPITLYAKTSKKGFCAGESIAMSAEFENLSNRKIIPVMDLYQNQTFIAREKTKIRRFKLSTFSGEAIKPGKCINWNNKLLKIPAVSPSIINCGIIRVDYFVRVSLTLHGGLDLMADLPITIGAIPRRRYNSSSVSSRTSTMNSMLNPILSPINNLAQLPPPYRKSLTPTQSMFEFPPSYFECISSDDEDEYIQNNELQSYFDSHAPPEYSEIDPYPSFESFDRTC